MVEHTLILLRHSKSDWSGDEADLDRPLADRGRRQAREAGRWLAAHVDRIDLAVVSTAVRARSTWDLVSTELGEQPQARYDAHAYAASAHDLLDLVRGLDEEHATVVVVAHNPGLEELAETLVGSAIPLPTSAIAVIGLGAPWRDTRGASGRLRASGRPPSG